MAVNVAWINNGIKSELVSYKWLSHANVFFLSDEIMLALFS